MENLSLLIKPSSSSCNMKCNYCFYDDISKNRSIGNFGFMSMQTIEEIIKQAFNLATKSILFTFQGGEPTLVGLDFFKNFHILVKKYNIKHISVNFSIQSNGLLLNNKEWISLLKKENYLVGISLDGFKEIHNTFRKTSDDKNTFTQILKTIKLLQKNFINYSILTVVNKITIDNIEDIYIFFKNSKFKYLQFIPCIDNFNNLKKNYSLTDCDYGYFLDKLFKLWYKDILNNKYTSIRFFDNLVSTLLTGKSEACDMRGICGINCVIESNGDIYPCDFYVLDDFLLGNIYKKNMAELLVSDKAYNFIKSSTNLHADCHECNYYFLCKGGCRRYKTKNNINILCKSFKYFYSKNYKEIITLPNYIKNFN